MSAQQAVDHMGAKLDQIYMRFDDAILELPSWEERVDQEVKRYIEGVKNCVRANLYWSFRTERYFGRMRKEVERTGKVDVLKHPSFLNNI